LGSFRDKTWKMDSKLYQGPNEIYAMQATSCPAGQLTVGWHLDNVYRL
jgi:hypothetical protein